MHRESIKFVLICLINSSLGANILILSGIPSPSHSIWIRPMATALAARGHNVTIISPDVEKTTPSNLSYIHLENLYSAVYNTSQREKMNFFEMADDSPFKFIHFIDEYTITLCKVAIKSNGFTQLMNYPKNFKFDLFISDLMMGPCFASLLLHRFGKPPYIPVSPFNGLTISAPLIGSYAYSGSIPNHAFDATEKMNFWERMKNWTYDTYEVIMKEYYLYPESDAVIKTVFPDAPSAKDLQSNIRLLFINSHPLTQYKESIMPNVISVGGMQIQKSNAISDDLNQIISKAKDGFILFSLGSNARSDLLGPERIKSILTTMKAFPQYQFLWKFESDESTLPMPVPENVIIRAWMPQNDLLSHPNIKLFITHSGLLSTHEAIWYGVPIISFPLFADQFRNINYCTSVGIGKRLSIQKFDTKDLIDAIEEMTSNPSYSNNMKRLSKIFRDQPETPLERAVWWVEWVLRNPDADMMQSSVVNLGWMQKYLYDVLLCVFTAVFALVYLTMKVVTRLIRRSSQSVKFKHE